MHELDYDVTVIGAGAAGMAAALTVAEAGLKVVILDREEHLGGILLQCIHNGFGLHGFQEDLTGPEYAERFIGRLQDSGSRILLRTTAMDVSRERDGKLTILTYSPDNGVQALTTKALILAMGCRERNRGNIGISGTRPAGIFTAGLAQRLLNIEGYLPGRKAVIVGSGDIGLIMARRLTWVGVDVLGVVEILPHPSGLTRNIVQCLHDFGIPLYLSHVVSRIEGRNRVEGVEITPAKYGRQAPDKAFRLECDTILLSVGLIPENELARKVGVEIYPDTGGAYVDANLMTNQEGIFACGNVLHVHDLVDFVSEEAVRCGQHVVDYVRSGGEDRVSQGLVRVGANVRYVVPHRYACTRPNEFFLRSLVVRDRVELVVRRGNQILKKQRLYHVRPSEMIRITLDREMVSPLPGKLPEPIEFALEV